MSEEENAEVGEVDVNAAEAAAEVMRPEFLQEKYATVEDQAKAYNDLSSQLGKQGTEMQTLKEFQEKASKVIGAPEDYEVPTFDDTEVDIEDPRFGLFKQFAKENDLSQDMFNEGLKLFAVLDAANQSANEDFAKEEMAKLHDADWRIKNIQDWASANISDHADGLAEVLTTAAGVEAVEAIMAKAGKAPVAPNESSPASMPSMEEIQAMQFATDANGDRKMRDPAYAAKVNRLLALHVGKGDHQVFVG